MENTTHFYTILNKLRSKIILAGLAGGIAEIVWISLYSHWSGISAANIARQISATVLPYTADSYYAPMLGIAIHLVLSVILAYAFVMTILKPINHKYGTSGIMFSSFIALAIIWKINFFFILPMINPSFTSLLPTFVTLMSKLLFGVTMGWVLIKNIPYHKYG